MRWRTYVINGQTGGGGGGIIAPGHAAFLKFRASFETVLRLAIMSRWKQKNTKNRHLLEAKTFKLAWELVLFFILRRNTHTHSLSLKQAYSLFHTATLIYLALSRSHTHTLTHIHTHSHAHTYAQTLFIFFREAKIIQECDRCWRIVVALLLSLLLLSL